MSLIQKTNPVGLDRVIAQIQKTVFDALTINSGWTKYDSYERAYLNPDKEGSRTLIPEIFLDNKDYRITYLDDGVSAESYFLANQIRPFDLAINNFKQEISLVFQLNLEELYPAILHRADEEAHKDVYNAIRLALGVDIKELVLGVKNVYEGLNFNQQTLDDMQPFHVFKYDLLVDYVYNC